MQEALDVLLQDPSYCHDQICEARLNWGATEAGDKQIRKMLGLIAFNTNSINVKERANSAIQELDLRTALIESKGRGEGVARMILRRYAQQHG